MENKNSVGFCHVIQSVATCLFVELLPCNVQNSIVFTQFCRLQSPKTPDHSRSTSTKESRKRPKAHKKKKRKKHKRTHYEQQAAPQHPPDHMFAADSRRRQPNLASDVSHSQSSTCNLYQFADMPRDFASLLTDER